MNLFNDALVNKISLALFFHYKLLKLHNILKKKKSKKKLTM